MQITKIESKGQKQVRIFLDEEKFCLLYLNEFRELGFRENQELTSQEWIKLQNLLLYRAKRKALALLKSRDRTRKELKERLMRLEFPERTAEDAVTYAEFYGYINDEEYVRRYMEYRAVSRSALQIRQELSQKGIDRHIIDRIWDEYEYDEMAILEQQLEKRIRQKGPVTQENFQKYYGFFARKGFSSNSILYLLKKYKQ